MDPPVADVPRDADATSRVAFRKTGGAVMTVRRYPEMQGRVALVTGGSSGIGLAAGQAFAREGATVVISSRDKARAQQALKTFDKDAAVAWVACDAASGKSVAALIEEIVRRHGRLDYAFNNGGSIGGEDLGLLGEMSEESWRRTIDGYLTSVFLCLRHELPVMLTADRGVIVNMASIYGHRGHAIAGGGAYAAAKHGVLGLTASAARQYASTGVRITAISPGWVATPPIAGWMKSDPAFAKTVTDLTPRGKIATPGEIANSVLWLCSDDAAPVIESSLIVDGGALA
jgi:NAD(P)-dependent dehydrogenase (short-subunit alcohol dehydrogenase family)